MDEMMNEMTNSELLAMPIEELSELDKTTIMEISSLKECGFQTIGSLIYCSNEEQKEYLFKIRFWKRYPKLHRKIMSRGILISDDIERFNSAGIKLEEALIAVDNLDFPLERKGKIVNCLKRRGIFFLGDLLTTHYGEFSNMDDIYQIDLKNYIHSLGYTFRCEELTKTEIRREFKKKGMSTIKDVLDIPRDLLNNLEYIGIYTVEQLLSCGLVKVYSLLENNFKLIDQLVKAMSLKEIYFEEFNIIKTKDNSKIMLLPIETLIFFGLLEFDVNYILTLKRNKICTIGDLVSGNINYIYKILKGNSLWSSEYWNFRKALLRIGLLFNDDLQKFANKGIKKEDALVSVESMNISISLKNVLIKNGVQCLGDILYTDYNKLLNCRGMGEKIVELREYIHSMGFAIEGEHLTKKEEKAILEREGVKTVAEELCLSKYLSGVLSFHNIVTIDDLMSKVPDIFYARKMGEKSINELKQAMIKHGLFFDNCFDSKDNNDDEKKKLLLELKYLIEKREEIRQKNRELTGEIKAKRLELRQRNPKTIVKS